MGISIRNLTISLSLSILAGTVDIYAVPADPRPKKITQPDGTELTVKIRGDERCHFYLSEDDYLLVRKADDTFYYADVDESGNIKVSDLKAVPASARTQTINEYLAKVDMSRVFPALGEKALASKKNTNLMSTVAEDQQENDFSLLLDSPVPNTGEQNVLIVLVEYADKAFTIDDPKSYFTRMFIQPGFSDYGATGSVRDYFEENSNGRFLPQFDVYGPITLAHNRSHYGGNDWAGNDKNPHEMAIEACQQLDDMIDFNDYDCDGDGYIDNIFLFYAGKGEASGGSASTVWPHSGFVTDYSYTAHMFDGVQLNKYGCSNELVGDKPDGIGTFVHEFSHVLGLPDLYATSYSSSFTPGAWSVLDYGPYNNDARTPPNYSVFERYALGWLSPKEIDGAINIKLDDITTDQACMIRTPKSTEFFLLENRQQHGWDEYIPGHGMLLWHIDYKKSVWSNNTVNNKPKHQYVDIVEADDVKSDQTRSGDSFPGASGVTSFTADTKPALCAWDGTSIDLPITEIAEVDGIIRFKVAGGITIPASPSDVKITEEGDTRQVTISWTAPACDEDGNPLDPASLTYMIKSATGEITDDIKDTSITFVVPESDDPFVSFTVFAKTSDGISEGVVTPILAVGQAVVMPVVESFDGGAMSMPFAIDHTGEAEWTLATDNMFLGVRDCDGTDGMMVLRTEFPGQYSELFFDKISLDADYPVMSISTYCISKEDINVLKVNVRDCATGDSECVKEIFVADGDYHQWTETLIDLSAYAGSNIMLSLLGECHGYGYLFVDGLTINQPADVDLRAVAISAPANVKPGETFDVKVDVMNIGAKPVEAFRVDLSVNGVTVASADGAPVAQLDVCKVVIPYSFSPLSATENVLCATVVCDADSDPSNNTTCDVSIGVMSNDYPTVNGLEAQNSGSGVQLSWHQPDLSGLGIRAVTDDFESYEPFATTDIGDWTLVDRDGKNIGGLTGLTIPGLTMGKDANAYFVMNYEELGLGQEYLAHSGKQYMMCIYTGYPQSDWLITPELYGEAQTVSFYARSYSKQYGLEQFVVAYSTTDTDVDSFIELDGAEVPVEWQKYEYELPAGAKYFAIVCVSNDKQAFFVDDVTYIPAGAGTLELDVLGYNVYRNGVLINGAPVETTGYFDADGKEGDVYVVTVVFAQGESSPSDEVVAQQAGIPSVASGRLCVKASQGIITISGAESPVRVYNATGAMLYQSDSQPMHQIRVQPGVYVVQAACEVRKIVVK